MYWQWPELWRDPTPSEGILLKIKSQNERRDKKQQKVKAGLGAEGLLEFRLLKLFPLGIPIFGKVKITLVVQVLPTRQLSTVWWHLYTIVCNPRSRQWCQMTSPSVVLYGWWAVPGRTREGEAIPLEGWQESLRGAKMSPKIGWVTARFPLGHVTGFVHFVLVPLTQKKWPRLSPFLLAPESR